MASAQGSSTTPGGIATRLTLTAPGYSRDVALLLQEKRGRRLLRGRSELSDVCSSFGNALVTA